MRGITTCGADRREATLAAFFPNLESRISNLGLMTYPDAIAYLESLIDYERTPAGAAAARLWNLDRIRQLLHAVGDPHLGQRYLHIAGTKGKGSTAAMAASILSAAGYRTGLYTSPHLVSFRERIRLDGALIGEEDVAALTEEVRPAIEALRPSSFGPPSFFEAYTLLACLYFRRQGAEVAVMETGLGGRLDATNALLPQVCAITRLGYDHMLELGDTLEQIAREKAGIIKPGVPVISAPQALPARAVLEEICRERGARLLMVGEDGPQAEVHGFDERGMRMTIRGLHDTYEVTSPLVGEHQAENAAVAVGLIDLLSEAGLPVPAEAIVRGFASVRWPGRLQVVRHHPTLVLDGAHDEAAAAVLAAALRSLYPDRRLVLVLGVGKDKDAAAIASYLCPLADRVIATAGATPRALDAEELHRAIFPYCRHVSAYTPVSLALQEALDAARRDDVIVVTGSLYVVGDAMRALGVSPI